MQIVRGFTCLILVALLFATGCSMDNATGPTDSAEVVIQSLIATPAIVPTGATALLACRASSINGTPLTYTWEGTGAVGYLLPLDSMCVFGSPSCHFGKATVTVTVSDASGASATKSVDLN